MVDTGALAVGLLAVGGLAAWPAGPGSAQPPEVIHAPFRALSAPGTVRAAHLSSQWAWMSSNWSGYVETGTFAGATASWTVPAVQPSAGATYSSSWTGVGGFDDSDLIQAGTEQDYFSGAAHYSAWWELLPAGSVFLPVSSYPVDPGDLMSVSVYGTTATASSAADAHRGRTPHVWVISISDVSRGWNYVSRQGYDGAGTSAEWIIEAPSIGSSGSTSLAHYNFAAHAGSGNFGAAGVITKAVAAGVPPFRRAGLSFSHQAGVMVQNSVQVSTPGSANSAGTAYNTSYGAATPSSPVTAAH